MSAVKYMTGQAAELAMNVVANIIGKMRGIKIKWHNGTAVDCDPFAKVLRIPRVACASMLDSTSLMLLRGMVYHEAGHLLFTKLPKAEWPKGALMEIWNAVEDRWMERGVRGKFPGAKTVLPQMSRHYNEKIAKQILLDGVDAPLWESLCAMGFMSDGIIPAWTLTPKAQLYFDAGYDTFIEWKGCKSSKGTLKVAKKLFDILKQVNDECKQDAPENAAGPGQPQAGEEGDEQDQQQPQQGGEGQNEQEGEPQSSGGADFDDYENEQNQQGGSSGDEEGEDGPDAGDKDGDAEGDEEGQKGDSKDDGGEDGSESGQGEEEGQKGQGGSESGKSGDADTESAVNDDSKATGQDEIEPGNGYNPKADGTDDSGTGDSSDSAKEKTWEEIAEQELKGGQKLNEAINDELAELLEGMAADHDTYTARRDKDIHDIPEGNKHHYQQVRKDVSGAVMTLTRALDQALRVLSKDRVHRGLRRGRFDSRRMVQAATGLSKNVFYKTSQGITLDTVVSIVIDESGSMHNMSEIRRLVIAVGEALTKIGVDFEVVGTTTKYCAGDHRLGDMDGFDRTNPIVYRHYKIFGENWMNVAQRVTAMRATNHNVDGEAVEYAALRLAGRKEARKVVFSICDGEPFSGHYNEYIMCKNLKDVCANVRKNGIEVYGFGVGTTGPERFYGKDNFIYLPNSDALGPEFVKRFASIVTGGRVKVGRSK